MCRYPFPWRQDTTLNPATPAREAHCFTRKERHKGASARCSVPDAAAARLGKLMPRYLLVMYSVITAMVQPSAAAFPSPEMKDFSANALKTPCGSCNIDVYVRTSMLQASITHSCS